MINDHELMEYFKEDVPYFDLTTSLQEASAEKVKLEIFTREDVIVSCSEEAKRVAELLGCEILHYIPSKQTAAKGEIILSFTGSYETVHQVWRRAQNILEYSCRIATYTSQMRESIHAVNPRCELLTTRKSFPFAKSFCIRSVLNGGGMPHRLGLSETVLFFPQHRIIYPSDDAFYTAIADFKTKAPEKKIVIEAETLEEATILMLKGADVIQVDKAEIETLRQLVVYRNTHFPTVKILAAGGIHKDNVSFYAATGIDGVVTTSVYFSGIADLGSRMEIVK